MNIAIVDEAKNLPPGEAELLCAKNGIEFHPVVCDAVTPGGCKHVSRAQRDLREAAYAKAVGKPVAVVAKEGAVAAAAEPEAPAVESTDDDAPEDRHVAAHAKKASGHK